MDIQTLFGIPTVLTKVEVQVLAEDLRHLWKLVYGSAPSSLEEDLGKCRSYFHPLLRGFTLRDRLSQVSKAPASLTARMKSIGEPLVVDTGDQRLLVGVEARLALYVLEQKDVSADHAVITTAEVSIAEGHALRVYREWCWDRLSQVIDLRAGAGKEVLQAPSVGLVIALLINRSTSLETAIVDRGESLEGKLTDRAVHLGAIRFAEAITTGRKKSVEEQKLRGGYIISEARRRLAHRLVVESDRFNRNYIYIPERYQDEVIAFLGRDLARRPSLTEDVLKAGLQELVSSFRSVAGDLANQAMIHERPADTAEIVKRIVDSFLRAKES